MMKFAKDLSVLIEVEPCNFLNFNYEQCPEDLIKNCPPGKETSSLSLKIYFQHQKASIEYRTVYTEDNVNMCCHFKRK